MIQIKPLNKPTKLIRIIKPELQSNLIDELNACLLQLDSILNKSENFVLIKISVFIKSENLKRYTEIKTYTEELLSTHLGSALPIVSFIPEPPAENYNLVLEATLFDNSQSDFHIDFYHFPQISYYIIAGNDFEEIYGVTADLNSNKNGVYAQTSNCFNEIDKILQENGLTLADIHRQWSYIGLINDFTDMNGKQFENYQQFNISRARYYSKCEWKNGFPAATGIGANLPGCTIEFLAGPTTSDSIIIPLHNPKQQDAHHYSEKYQVKELTLFQNDNHENTPKFERGKIVINANMMDVYISGTAAILGEDSINQKITEQTEITLHNISELYSKQNLYSHGLQIDGDLPKFQLLRVYIKNPEDYSVVQEICNRICPEVPLLIVVADVCRKELLVEIEAYANSIIERI
jgi:enamine deaminase RidA (YjgF/YER057c/UK114 family)